MIGMWLGRTHKSAVRTGYLFLLAFSSALFVGIHPLEFIHSVADAIQLGDMMRLVSFATNVNIKDIIIIRITLIDSRCISSI